MRRRRVGLPASALALLLVLPACSVPPLVAPEQPSTAPVALPSTATRDGDPSDRISIAYPSEPSSLLDRDGTDPAAGDLQALWGLPLLRLDGAGQVRRGLVQDWTVVGPTDDGWQVDLVLGDGAWSDGRPVVADDVVATLDAARKRDPGRFGLLGGAEALDESTVAVRFARPHAAWADLLVEVGTVLPAGVWAGGADGFEDATPVSGGWFSVEAYEPGLRLLFSAHPDGPLGAPSLERVEVLFVPAFETARGLLAEGEVDGLLGYLALNGVARARELEGVEAGAPLGGTTVSLRFRPDGALGGTDLAARRRGVAETVDVRELVEGMLGPTGAPANSPWPGVDGPDEVPPGEVREGQQFTLLYPADSGVLGFTARAIQRDLTSRGMTVELAAEPAPRFAEVVGTERDVALVVDRTSGRPSLSPWLDDREAAQEADAAVMTSTPADEGLAALSATARLVPLFRVGVLHAWRGIEGLRPSSWRGAGFWNVGEWRAPDA